MPSSTFSFDCAYERAPAPSWPALWMLSGLVAVSLFGVVEQAWRVSDYQPSVVDSPALWSLQRARVVDGGEKSVALLGASRMQLGFCTDLFRQRYPGYQLSNLAIIGRHPVAVLNDLAKEPSFKGLVICAITAPGFQRECWNEQQLYVDYYHREHSVTTALDTSVGAFFTDRCVVLNPALRLDRVVHSLLSEGRLPTRQHTLMRNDRSRTADYSLLGNIDDRRQAAIVELRRNPGPSPAPPEAWMKDVREVDLAVQAIQNRGGRVVFVRFPTSGARWELENERFPKAVYWDRLAAGISAVTIHFKDVPSLADFECPDMSHLDRRDAPRFTAALLQELERRGVLPRGESLDLPSHSENAI